MERKPKTYFGTVFYLDLELDLYVKLRLSFLPEPDVIGILFDMFCNFCFISVFYIFFLSFILIYLIFCTFACDSSSASFVNLLYSILIIICERMLIPSFVIVRKHVIFCMNDLLFQLKNHSSFVFSFVTFDPANTRKNLLQDSFAF